MPLDDKKQPIVIKRVKKIAHGHHGGSWKVAFADFVTAMMAFFLVMWIVGAATTDQKAAISQYFKNPSLTEGMSQSPTPGPMGPGGASTSMIDFGGSMDLTRGEGEKILEKDKKEQRANQRSETEATGEDAKAADHKRLESLLADLKEAIGKSQALKPFKDQLLLDITPEGLRIQIVDKENRPMFDSGSSELKSYTVDILHEIAKFVNQVPNRISIAGHTDITPYVSRRDYSNWELSADRANAARRSLIAGGMDAGKMGRVVGLASSVLFDKDDPRNPINRRISIVVMNQETDDALRNGEQNPTSKVTAVQPPVADTGSQAVISPPAPTSETTRVEHSASAPAASADDDPTVTRGAVQLPPVTSGLPGINLAPR